MSLSKPSHLTLSPLHCPGCDRPAVRYEEVAHPDNRNQKYIRMWCSENHQWTMGAVCPECKKIPAVGFEDGVPVLNCCDWKFYAVGLPRTKPCPKCLVNLIEIRVVNDHTGPEGKMFFWCEDCGRMKEANANPFRTEVEL